VDDVIGWSEFLQQLASLIPLRKQTIDSQYSSQTNKQTNTLNTQRFLSLKKLLPVNISSTMNLRQPAISPLMNLRNKKFVSPAI
jgi:hypothetical protein